MAQQLGNKTPKRSRSCTELLSCPEPPAPARPLPITPRLDGAGLTMATPANPSMTASPSAPQQCKLSARTGRGARRRLQSQATQRPGRHVTPAQVGQSNETVRAAGRKIGRRQTIALQRGTRDRGGSNMMRDSIIYSIYNMNRLPLLYAARLCW